MKDEEKKEEHVEEPEVDTDPGDNAFDDVTFEENTEDVGVHGVDAHAKIKKFKERIKELEEKNTKLLDSWQRDKADFINARKQDEVRQKDFLKFANEGLITDLLPALDAFESAMKNKEAWEKADKNWRIGVEYIHSQILNVLTQNGLKVVNPVGERYDAARDEAMETVSVQDPSQDGKVLEVVQLGYSLNGKEIRAPKVKVGHLEK
jgi:molecular chaperone GrpE